MNLLANTYIGNGTEATMPSDAALMSLLPFGLGRKDALALYFSSTRNGNRAVKAMAEAGLVEEHSQEIKSQRHPYQQPYLALTLKGLAYLAEKYPQEYPWLADAVQRLREQGRVSFIRGLSPGTIRSLLTAHLCNVAWNVVEVGTILERLIYEPEKALTAMTIHMATTRAGETAFGSIYEAFLNWLEGERFRRGGPVHMEHPCSVQFYDSVELKAPDNSPYRKNDRAAPTQLTASIVERRERMAGHVGLLKTSNHLYLVFLTTRDGVNWNSALVEKSWQSFGEQSRRLGLIHSLTEAPRLYPAIMLVDGKGEKVSAFARVVHDPCGLRGRKDRIIGCGTSALHAVPIVRGARHFLRFFTREKYDASFRRLLLNALMKTLPETFQASPMGAKHPLMYQHRVPCYFGMDLELQQIYAAMAEPCAIVCMDWQAPYIRVAVPDAVIVVVDVEKSSTYEYEN